MSHNIGEGNPKARLTEGMVIEMRQKHKAGVSIGKLCIEFNVDRATASRVVNRKTWNHVN